MTFEIRLPHVAIAWALLGLASVAIVRRVAPVGPFPSARRPLIELASERLPYAAAGLALLFLVVQSLWLADPCGLRPACDRQRPAGRDPIPRSAHVRPRDPRRDGPPLRLGVARGHAEPRGRGRRGPRGRVAAAVRGPSGVCGRRLVARSRSPGSACSGSSRRPASCSARRPSALATFGAAVALAIVAPLDRLVVDATTTVPAWAILTDATVALGALAVATGIGALIHRGERLSLPALLAAGVVVVYMLSVGVVDHFQVQVARAAARGAPEGGPGRPQRTVVGPRRRRVRDGPPRAPAAGSPVRPWAAGARHREGLPRRPRCARRRVPGPLARGARGPAAHQRGCLRAHAASPGICRTGATLKGTPRRGSKSEAGSRSRTGSRAGARPFPAAWPPQHPSRRRVFRA